MPITDKQIHEALQIIIDNKEKKALNWAVNYTILGQSMTGHSLKVQCLYVLSNISYWRGEDAKRVRSLLKEFTKSVS